MGLFIIECCKFNRKSGMIIIERNFFSRIYIEIYIFMVFFFVYQLKTGKHYWRKHQVFLNSSRIDIIKPIRSPENKQPTRSAYRATRVKGVLTEHVLLVIISKCFC